MEAGQSQQKLLDLFQQLLESNHDISRRLQGLESLFDAETIRTAHLSYRASVAPTEMEALLGEANTHQSSPLYSLESGRHGMTIFQPSFQIDLEASRVYARTQQYTSDASFTTSIARTHAWSVFSMISLSQVSCISAIALPIYSEELSTTERYEFGGKYETAGPSNEFRVLSVEQTNDHMNWVEMQKLKSVDTTTSQTLYAAVEAMDTPSLSPSSPKKKSHGSILYKIAVLGDEKSRKFEIIYQV